MHALFKFCCHPPNSASFLNQEKLHIFEMVSVKHCVVHCITLCVLSGTCLCIPHESTYEIAAPTGSTEDADRTDHRYFLKEIFNKYGNGGHMSFEGFEHLLESLGLGNVIIKDHNVKDHKESDVFKDTHDTHEHSPQSDQPSSQGKTSTKDSQGYINLPLPKHKERQTSLAPKDTTKTSHEHDGHSHYLHHHYHDATKRPSGQLPELLGDITSVVEKHKELNVAPPKKAMKQCLSPLEMLMVYDMDINKTLDPSSFIHLCPVIVWELEGGHCTHANHDDEDVPAVTLQQWLYSSLAILIISLCGLFSVAVIPIMQKWFYHTLLQYLVGLAIGSLSGDAMLHLMPHALQDGGGDHGHNHGGMEEKEAAAVWKGLAALGGIYFFFIAERCLNALTVYKSKRKAKKIARAPKLVAASFFAPSVVENKNTVGEKLSQYRKSSYGVPNGTDGKETVHMLPEPIDDERSATCNGTSRKDSSHSVHEVAFHGRSSFSAEPNVYYHESSPSDNYVVTVSDHHGHGHGHSHEVPKSISAVAWMVIMGDGLHNFCDGLAIGTAFASGVPGGVSTAVAVFCHELPHELGDFAMLLKTGMRVKQALLYNGLSSVLCFLGMVIGVSLGNVDSATTWVFSITAGMFLYIALVDMLPELSSPTNEPGSTSSYELAVQVLGISTGISIMLIIANYEHDLERLVS